MIDLLGELRRIQSRDAAETFNPATDSLEALSTLVSSLQGLIYYGTVTNVPGANQFDIADLVGLGETKFVNWTAFVFWDAGGAGAAPQGEQQNITAYGSVNGRFTTVPFTAPVAVGDQILIIHPGFAAIVALIAGKPNISTIFLPLLGSTLGVAVVNDDGTAPAYSPLNTTVAGVGAPAVGWTVNVNLEQEGAVNVISVLVELEWQSQFTVGAGAGTDTNSRVEMSGDGGVTFIPVTDWFTHANAGLTTRVREGVGLWVAGIATGINQLRFRLVHYVGGADGVSQSSVQMRSNSFATIIYRKS